MTVASGGSLTGVQRPVATKHQLASHVILPVAIVVGYFVVPLGYTDAPIGLVLGVLVAAAAVVTCAVAVVGEVKRLNRRFGVRQLVLALEVVIVAFAIAYYVLASHQPGQFVGLQTRLDALYFTVTMASTVGFGDVHATGQLARGLVTANMAFNLAFLAALVALFQDRLRPSAIPHPHRGEK